MRVGERFAPIGHREIGVQLTRRLKLLPRVGIFEAVEQQNALDKVFLCCIGARRREVHVSQASRLGRGGHRQDGNERSESSYHDNYPGVR